MVVFYAKIMQGKAYQFSFSFTLSVVDFIYEYNILCLSLKLLVVKAVIQLTEFIRTTTNI